MVLDLPSSQAQALEIKEKEIFIELSSDKLALFGEEISFEDFDKQLSKIDNKKRTIIVRIDKNVEYQRVVKILDTLQKYDLNNLSLVTKKD